MYKDSSNSAKIKGANRLPDNLPRASARISNFDHFLVQSAPAITFNEDVQSPLTFANLVQWFEEPSFYGKLRARGLDFILTLFRFYCMRAV